MKTYLTTPLALGIVVSGILAGATGVYAKVKPVSITNKPKNLEINFVKGIHGGAQLKVQQTIQVPNAEGLIQFQDGKVTDEVAFYQSPRCYIHFKEDAPQQKQLDSGKDLKVSKIDNVYRKGSVHVVFWFDDDATVKDLTCITNYNHTLTINELKNTLGNLVEVSMTKSVELEALFNTAPAKSNKTLSEDTAANNFPIHSARVILQGT